MIKKLLLLSVITFITNVSAQANVCEDIRREVIDLDRQSQEFYNKCQQNNCSPTDKLQWSAIGAKILDAEKRWASNRCDDLFNYLKK